MFWFHHPRPPNRKEVAEQIVERKTAVPDIRVLVVEPTRPATAPLTPLVQQSDSD